MDIDKQKLFDAFMESFTELETIDKNKEIIEKQKNIMAYIMNYLTENNIGYDFYKSKEINDILDGPATNEDYLEAMMVYMQNIEQLVGVLLNNR